MYFENAGNRRSQARNNARVHKSPRTLLEPFPYTLTREVSNDEIPPYEVEDKGDRANHSASAKLTSSELSNAPRQVRPSLRQRPANSYQLTTSRWDHTRPSTSRVRISRRRLLLEPQETVGDDDCTRRPPWATSTMKTGAFPFNVRIETTSDIIHRDSLVEVRTEVTIAFYT
ncbi:hypothetical protein CRG98_006716 [Punica granatum]|uniref:Uncharacterized protein n=1 Tax=Punica granatum TaxID=22663 RepID=A0A2I0KWR5_PUNGR|nr:hypothetical protein CRG98_006716 [Punica granatum]